MGNLFKISYLRNILIVSLVIALGVPIYVSIFIYPAFTKSLIKSAKQDAITADVAATYVPSVKEHSHNGAFESLHDITGSKDKLARLASTSLFCLYFLSLSFLGTIVLALAKAGRSIDERENAHEALHKNISRYRSFLESVGQGYYEVDLAGNLVFFNEFLAEILGYSKDALLGMSYRQYMDQKNAGKILRVFYRVYKTGKPKIGIIGEVINKDGLIREIGTSVSLMKDADDKPIGFRGMARDISERKIIEEQFSESKKLESIGQLAAGIAHEINTPTQYVNDNMYFLKDSFNDMNQILQEYETLFKAIKAGKVSNKMVQDLENNIKDLDVDYLREEVPVAIRQSLEGIDHVAKIMQAMKEFSHHGPKEKTATNINKIIQNAITISRNKWKYVADMETDFDDSLPPVPCLPGEFSQVVLNMIINAAHAISDVVGDGSEKKGVITITTHHNKQWAEVHISDTGAGIPDEIREKIFDPFFTTKDIGAGTGQGLAIANAIIVKQHGGTISFKTEPGTGTTFIIRLPLENSYE